jgi:hypothetical protein
VRLDRIDPNGAVTLRYRGQLHHVGVRGVHRHKEVIELVAVLVADLVRPQLTDEGEMLSHLTLYPSRDRRASGRTEVSDHVLTHLSMMS